jgi:hypothetical protein
MEREIVEKKEGRRIGENVDEMGVLNKVIE